MREFQKKQNIKRALYSKPMLAFMVVVLLFLMYVTWNMYTKAMIPYANRTNAEEKLAGLEAREVELTSRIKMLGTEEGVEAEVREKFGLVRKGEEVVVIIEDNTESENDGLRVDETSFWQKILRTLGM